jgi:hypothetical protein
LKVTIWSWVLFHIICNYLLLKGVKDEPFDTVAKEKQKVKDQIDLKIEQFKEELEKLREELYKEVDQIGDKALE